VKQAHSTGGKSLREGAKEQPGANARSRGSGVDMPQRVLSVRSVHPDFHTGASARRPEPETTDSRRAS
ncbi:hypothetical protein FRC09_020889, partial [Ceratobasidium sp. 395]